MEQRSFLSLPPEIMAELIRTSEAIVIYAAPGLDQIIAKAIIYSVENIGADNVSVLIDTDEKPYRLGYGTIEGINLLRNRKIPIRHAPNLRIGCLVCDDSGWIFSPTPLLIEAGSVNDLEPNAISVSTTQIERLIQSINPVLDVGDERIKTEIDADSEIQRDSLSKEHGDNIEDEEFIKTSLTPEIGQQIVTDDKLEKVRKSLDENPPQKFDIARRVQVFESYIEFVEISLLGCEIHRHTAPIPSKLLVGGADDQTVKQLKAAFQIIEKNSKISNNELRKKVTQLRRDYTRSITKYGNVMLKAKKKDFLKKVEQIQQELVKYREKVNNSVGEEIGKKVFQTTICRPDRSMFVLAFSGTFIDALFQKKLPEGFLPELKLYLQFLPLIPLQIMTDLFEGSGGLQFGVLGQFASQDRLHMEVTHLNRNPRKEGGYTGLSV